MADQASKARALEGFLSSNDAYIHPDIHIAEDEAAGVHFRATPSIEPGATIVSVPHSLTISYLNALVDEDWPLFKQQKHRFKIEAIGFFYLMVLYVERETSFWKPYLDALPGPELEHTQPLFFEDDDDVVWLEGTDVWHTNLGRKEVYREYYESGMEVLRAAGVNTEPLTWHLFKWAASMFTSRSFSSRALRPQDSKYWTAYRRPKNGERKQAVLLDMSRTPAEDLDFPVLFPGLDVGNHNHHARIDYNFNPGRFDITSRDAYHAGDEVFNNYGRKGNDELLLGYGFCIPGNPYDTVAMTLKAPPESLQAELKVVHPGYFTSHGRWSREQATVKLAKPIATAEQANVFRHLPEPLLELLTYIVRHEHGLPFAFIERPMQYLMETSEGNRYLAHIARMIVQSLAPKIAGIQATNLPSEPQNARQRQASVYRRSQLNIFSLLIAAFRSYTRSLLQRGIGGRFATPCLAPLENFVGQLERNDQFPEDFFDGIAANANTSDMEQLRLSGWEEDVWVLLLCSLVISSDERAPSWLPAYVDPDKSYSAATYHSNEAHGLLEIIQTAAQAHPDSIWGREEWTAALIAEVGKMVQYDSFMVLCPGVDGGEDEPRLCLYLLDVPWPQG